MKTENNSHLILIILLCLTFIGCNKEEDPTVQDMLVGTWTIESVSIEILIDGIPLSQYCKDVLGLSDAETEQVVDANYTPIEDHYSGTMEFISDGTYEFKLDGGTATEDGEWVMHPLNDEAISISYRSGAYNTYNITTLNETDFVIYFEETSRFDVDGDKLRDDVTYKLEISLVK